MRDACNSTRGRRFDAPARSAFGSGYRATACGAGKRPEVCWPGGRGNNTRALSESLFSPRWRRVSSPRRQRDTCGPVWFRFSIAYARKDDR